MFGWVYEIHAANRFLSETTRWSMPLSWGKVLDARMNLLVFSMFDVVTPLLMWFMTTFATALLPRLFSGTRELERVPPACCNLRSANVSPHQPKPANPAGREIVVLSLKFLRVAILFILSHKWRRLVGWLLPSQAHDCSNNLLCEQLPKRSQWWGSYLTKSLMICKMRLLEIWQSHWMESLWKKFTFCWELAIHGHTGNEIQYAFKRPSLQFHDVWRGYIRMLSRQSLQLWKFTWGSGAGEPAGNKAAVVPWQIQFPKDAWLEVSTEGVKLHDINFHAWPRWCWSLRSQARLMEFSDADDVQRWLGWSKGTVLFPSFLQCLEDYTVIQETSIILRSPISFQSA